jgi:hypothetical protein
VYIWVWAIPRVAVWCENLSNLPRVPRGTPRPAESLRNTNEFGVAICDVGSGFELAAINVG